MGKIYGLVGEYGQGPMFLSYLLGGKVKFDDLKLYYNDTEIKRHDLERISWNLEPHYEKYKKAVVKKSIEKAIRENQCEEDFMKHIADECIYIKQEYDVEELKERYQELFGTGEWLQ